jgi:hypothetical protein
MGIYLRSVHKAHVPITRPAVKHKIRTIHKNKALIKQDKKNMRGKSNKKSTRAK